MGASARSHPPWGPAIDVEGLGRLKGRCTKLVGGLVEDGAPLIATVICTC